MFYCHFQNCWCNRKDIVCLLHISVRDQTVPLTLVFLSALVAVLITVVDFQLFFLDVKCVEILVVDFLS